MPSFGRWLCKVGFEDFSIQGAVSPAWRSAHWGYIAGWQARGPPQTISAERESHRLRRTVSTGETVSHRSAFLSRSPLRSSSACRDEECRQPQPPPPPPPLPRRLCACDELRKTRIVYSRDDIAHRAGDEGYQRLLLWESISHTFFFICFFPPGGSGRGTGSRIILPRSHLTLRLRQGSQA